MKWVTVSTKQNYLVMHREDKAMTIRIYPDTRLSPTYKGANVVLLGSEHVAIDTNDPAKIEFHITYYKKEMGDKLKEALAGIGHTQEKFSSYSDYHADNNNLHIATFKSDAWLDINKILTVLESLDENGKDSLVSAREYLKDKVDIPEPLSLRSHGIRAVQRQIDAGNKTTEESAKKYLPADLKDLLRFSDYKLLRSLARFDAAINDNRNLHLEHPGMLPPPIYYAKAMIQEVERLDPSSKYIPELKKKFKERFNIDYEKAITVDKQGYIITPKANEPPKDKGGSTPGCVIS